MPDRLAKLIARTGTHVATAGMVLAMLMVTVGAGWPQATRPLSLGVQIPAPAQSSPPAREENPGLIGEIGKLFEKPLAILPTLKSPHEAVEDLNSHARDVGDNLIRLAKPTQMVTGRMGCPAAANGAPDCKAAADKLCQAKGFREGKSLDTDAAEKCSPKMYLPGYKRQPGDCRTENYVTRALCQ